MIDKRKQIEDNVEQNYKDNPKSILYTLLVYACNGKSSLDDVHYFLFIRIRKCITEKILKDKQVFEMLKAAFESKHAYNFIKLLEEVELLEIIFPNIYNLIKINGGHYHNETVYSHVLGALRALDKLSIPWYVKLAALYHDCGKQKWEFSPEGKLRFTDHAPFGAQLVEGDLRRLKFPRGIISTIKTLVCYHMSHMNDGMEIHAHALRKIKAKFDEMKIPLKYFFWIRYADNMGSAAKKSDFAYYWKVYRKSLRVLNPPYVPSIKDLKINGHDLIREFEGIEGRCIGFILNRLFSQWNSGEIDNEYDILLSEARFLKLEWEQ